MSERAESPVGASQLHATLLDYFRAPGKYQLSLRQPALLFASVREILQLASGRDLDVTDPSLGQELREAAGFFVRAALLYPGADHYAVLGLPSRVEPVELKERYRLLMRLTHPDFATDASVAWSADAAVRVNRAYEVLSSPVLRREYDEQLAGVRTAGTADPAPARPVYTPVPARREQRQWQLNPKAAWALAAGAGALTLVLLLPGPETPHLVQKLPAAKPLGQVAAAAPPAETTAAVLIPAEVLPLPTPKEPAPVAMAPAPATPAPQAPTGVQAAPRPQVPPAALPAPVSPPAATLHRPTPIAAPVPPGPTAAELAAAHRRSQAEAAARAAAEAAPPSRSPAVATPAPARAPEAPAVVVAAAPPPIAPAAASPPRATQVAAAVHGPTLNDAQPLLTQLLHLLESGNGDQVLRLLESDARNAASAQALSRHYEQLVRGARPVRLSHVEFRSESRDGVLLVTGRIRLHAGEPTIGSPGERLLLRAEFQSRGGKVLLTGLGGAPD